MKRNLIVMTIGLAAAAAGFIGGFLITLALGGLGAAGWVPVGQVAGAGLGAGIAVGTAARVEPHIGILIAVAGTLAGLGLGLAVRAFGDLEWALAGAFVLAVSLSLTGRVLAEASS